MRVLVVDDDADLRLSISQTLKGAGHEVVEAEDGQNAVALVTLDRNFDAVFLDVNMPQMNGIDALQKIKEISPEVFCLVLTAYSDVKDAMTAIRLGAYDYLEKPVEAERLLSMLDRAQEARNLVKKIAFSAPSVSFDEGREMIGGSSEIKKVFEVINKLSKVDTSVLIRGESGTGKELVARAIHYNSSRKSAPFVAVNLAAVPENLIESELFGHEKGAFTGADKRKPGKFHLAAGGTIFLDEIGDISAAMQVKLLRILQEKTFTPVGSNEEVKANIRIISATHRPLEEMIKTEKFRSDLFYRLNVLPIFLPPLRKRIEDIGALSKFLITKFNRIHGRAINSVSFAALSAMKSYPWPGNIRELENVLEHAFIMEPGSHISINALPEHIKKHGQGVCNENDPQPMKSLERQGASASATLEGSSRIGQVDESQDSGQHDQDVDVLERLNWSSDSLNFPELKEQFEKEFLIKALKAHGGKINKTSENTKMTKVTLLRKIEKYGINPKDYCR